MILLNGVETDSIAVTDRGLHYGDGLFETIAIVAGRPQLWQYHLHRLNDGCRRLGIELPVEGVLLDEAMRLCEGVERGVLKLILTRGSGGRGYRAPAEAHPQRIFLRYPWPDFPDVRDGIRLRLCHTPLACNPALAGMKHLNRLEQVMARNEWDDSSIHEGVMADLAGNLIEGTMSNLFWVSEGRLFTPDLSRCGVAGVMRAQVVMAAEHLGIESCYASIDAVGLCQVDEVFVCNSLIGIWPVVQFDPQRFVIGETTRRLQQQLALQLES